MQAQGCYSGPVFFMFGSVKILCISLDVYCHSIALALSLHQCPVMPWSAGGSVRIFHAVLSRM
jgi:hypothetical protein